MVDIMQTALRTLVAFCFLACSSTVTGGADDLGYAGSAGMASAGSAGSDSVGSGGAAIGGGNNAGDTSSGGSASVAGSVANGGGGAAPIDCTAPLPTTFVWSSSYDGTCITCIDSPCWTVDLTWDATSLHYDEVASVVSISVAIHSTETIRIQRMNNCDTMQSCAIAIPDATIVAKFKVSPVSNGYQIIDGVAQYTWHSAAGYVQPGTCSSYLAQQAEQNLGYAWEWAFKGIVLPCVQPSA
jgi:hypothetical protein